MGERTIGWEINSPGTCFYCEEPIEEFRYVKVAMPSTSVSFHEGECWDLFVVAVAIFNDTLVDLEKGKPN